LFFICECHASDNSAKIGNNEAVDSFLVYHAALPSKKTSLCTVNVAPIYYICNLLEARANVITDFGCLLPDYSTVA
jgi:hypothetical protein